MDCDTNDCTFREAIQAVEYSQTIAFNIEGNGPHIIQLNSAMDGLFRQSVTIDGYTQPGAAPNSAAAWEPGNADIRIVLDGSTIPGGQDSWGLWLSAKNLTVRGLSFVNFDDEAIKFATFPSAAIKGNYIGLYPDGHTVGPNAVGITLRSSEPGNLIGGYVPADRNVISGNTGAGLAVTGSSEVAIAGNFIGTDASGTLARPNGGNGIDMRGGPGSTIGGALAGSGNLRLRQHRQRDRNLNFGRTRPQREGQPHRHNGGQRITSAEPSERRLPGAGRLRRHYRRRVRSATKRTSSLTT